MKMAEYIEKKVHFLGSWKNNRVDNQTIAQINSQIATEKGNRVKLQLSRDGIRVVKSTMIQGKMLHDFIPLDKIQFMTVSRNLPDLLMVISLTSGDNAAKFQVHAFRCANGLDAGVYVGTFRTLHKNLRTVKVVKTVIPQPKGNKDDEINWTLRSKEYDNSKRELKQLVDLHGEKAVVHKIGNGTTIHIDDDEEQPVMTNGHTEVFENGVRIPLYRKGRPTRMERESFESDVSDNRSEVSESALRSELENLSQELRDIKIMLEKSTGIASEPGSPREFEPVKVQVHTHSVQPEQVHVKRTTTYSEPKYETVVVNEPVRTTHQENGYHVTGDEGVTHVRVNVPDYRNFSEGTSSYTVTTTSRPEVQNHTVTMTSQPNYEVVKQKGKTTSYENWKKNTIERNAIRYSDLPERIRWQSRDNRASHVVSVRPRSALPSWSTDAVDSTHVKGVKVRHHNVGLGPAYQHVSFNPRVVKMQDRKTQSLRASRGLSTTVAKPIDKVYIGRPDAKHHSLSYRSNSAKARSSILVKETNGVDTNVQNVVVEQNNNIVKHDNDDADLLDVSGLDLYKETPSEGVVIRT
ncbi:uncharacterized protein LOC123535455 [Mercenaria mercenaria]|uniref:uncharacterized protein LOC123535455 n=1 Tax=Mercenaria mercenaria TaxID=6596 RepID=UPI001E1D340E|nr:uncharacterized protein LOC123535455 [Mercenaria mercenaria]XP_045174070.1 uncharacterized protein LOC123535455 [Mercenaria mercenaria]XP_045174071.1 uncharacterized protein LOC123535455 [Mercenaria mercenaria]XP_045174073.1 uncharacterized protein LOC123535455 [Mercenaria mercenaria]XP_045174074.1 uncharacterized protein LOC123535455 [Mercenaria mercenaria]